MANDVVLVAVGCLTGVLAGMLGAGGGFATVVLLLAAGADPHVAVGTSLVYLMVMGGWGTFVHLRIGSVDRRLVGAIGLAAAVSALLGAQAAEWLGNRDLTLALGLFTACVSGISLAWPQTRRPLSLVGVGEGGRAWEGGPGWEGGPAPGEGDPVVGVDLDRTVLGGSVAGGSAIGVLKGLFGVGAGFLIVPLMVTAARVPRRLAVGSSIFAILVASVAASLRHLTLGNVDWGSLWWLIPGGLFGSFVGARAAHSMSPAAIRRVFLAMMGGSTVYLLLLASAY
jgi:uncharacterized membrane protein YfcA